MEARHVTHSEASGSTAKMMPTCTVDTPTLLAKAGKKGAKYEPDREMPKASVAKKLDITVHFHTLRPQMVVSVRNEGEGLRSAGRSALINSGPAGLAFTPGLALRLVE
jgi:hypothetical protein